jgi:rubrerythrin
VTARQHKRGGSKRGAEGERATGAPNTIYDLSSVLSHALEGRASYDTYIEDAEREGDQGLGRVFRQVRDEDSNRADRAQQLAERTPTSAGVVRGLLSLLLGSGHHREEAWTCYG